MSYQEFIDSLGNGINLFYNGLTTIASAMINNYIIITLLGLSIFTSLFYLFLNKVFSLTKKSNKNDLDNVRGDK